MRRSHKIDDRFAMAVNQEGTAEARDVKWHLVATRSTTDSVQPLPAMGCRSIRNELTLVKGRHLGFGACDHNNFGSHGCVLLLTTHRDVIR